METFTKEQIQEWFDWMIKKYPNCKFNDSLKHVKAEMLGNMFTNNNSIEEFLKTTNK